METILQWVGELRELDNLKSPIILIPHIALRAAKECLETTLQKYGRGLNFEPCIK